MICSSANRRACVALTGWLLVSCGGGSSAAAATSLSEVTVSEAADAGTVILDLKQLRSEVGLNWELHGHYDELPFQVDAEHGRLLVSDPAWLDSERRSEYRLTLRAVAAPTTDPARDLFVEDLQRSGAVMEATTLFAEPAHVVRLKVRVTDAAKPPVFASHDPTILRLDPTHALEERFMTAVDPDADEALRYGIIAGNDELLVECDAATGRIRLTEAGRAICAESRFDRLLSLQLRVTDSQGAWDERFVEVHIPGAGRITDWSVTPDVEVDADDLPIAALVADAPHPSDLPDSTLTVESMALPPLDATTSDQESPVAESTTTPVDSAATPDDELAPAVEVVRAVKSDASVESLPAVIVPRIAPLAPVQVAPVQVQPAGLTGPSGLRAETAANTVGTLMQMVISWVLLTATFIGLAAAAMIALRRRGRLASASEEASDSSLEPELPLEPQPVPPLRMAGRKQGGNRSLRQEMSNLLAVSQHFTNTQQAQADKHFYGRQLRLAAIAAIAASGIALGQAYLGLDHGFDHRNWIVLACLTLIVAAAVKSFMAMREASQRALQPGPLSDEFRLD